MKPNGRHLGEITSGRRFAFGDNWARFLAGVDEERIRLAEASLCGRLKVRTLEGERFLDVGTGSGLFSLAARRLGATVHSFDYDPRSAACAAELSRRYCPDDPLWTIERGSVLDEPYMKSLGEWDIVYSWGVLHHTGDLARALRNVTLPVRDGGRLFLAVYNDQGRASRYWLRIKRLYNRLPGALRWVVLGPAVLRLWGPTTIRDLVRGRPLHTWRAYPEQNARGMSPWRDVVDWVGGLPFEVATPELVFRSLRDRGFQLEELETCAGGHGCNEFVFRRTA